MTAIDTLRHALTVGNYSDRTDTANALADVEALLEAAKFALPCIDPNATLASNTLAAAVRRVDEGRG